jgi:predicted CXXCH cytochrome family protein
MTRVAALAAAVLALGPLPALGADAPHDLSQTANSQPVSCQSCHVAHNAPGVSLTSTAGNSAVCASCHTTTNFGFPYATADQAAPGGGGVHHRWDSAAASAPGATDSGAQLPTNSAVLTEINGNGGNLSCSACHDQHRGASSYGPATIAGGSPRATQHLSAVTKTPPASGGTVAVTTLDGAASPRGYLIKISPDTTHFILSNDGGTSWWCYSGGWTTNGCTGSPVTGPGQATGANVSLNDPAGAAFVKATFTGSPAVGDTFGFYVSYPFPRMSSDKSAMCENCHAPRVMNAAAASTGADGTKQFSHPVGDSLVASTRTYDRSGGAAPLGNILDANGVAQTTGDGNATNDLRLASDGTVRCMSCHYPHATDSNSLSVHPR